LEKSSRTTEEASELQRTTQDSEFFSAAATDFKMVRLRAKIFSLLDFSSSVAFDEKQHRKK
jgi:hypothetical protein